jgi:hypothetical protein
VQAGFDESRQNYVIRTLTGCSKYREVFINYGPHSNRRLLLEYGFMVDDNPHDGYAFTLGYNLLSSLICLLVVIQIQNDDKQQNALVIIYAREHVETVDTD